MLVSQAHPWHHETDHAPQTEADREVLRAQGTAVSITQAAAAIVGTFIGSSLLTVFLVYIILRYRRKKRRDRDNYGDYGGDRPGTRGSYNSMADGGARDLKERPSAMLSPSTTRVGGLTRTNTLASAQNNKNTTNNNNNWEVISQPPTADPLPKLGVVRRPTGEALSTNYATSKAAERKPLKLAEPPPARKKGGAAARGAAGDGNDDYDKPGSGGASTGGTTWSVFPKVDPDPKGVLAAAAQRELRPGSTQQAASLQKWLSTAVTVSPFGPLDSDSGPSQRPSNGNNNTGNNINNNSNNNVTSKGAAAPGRMSEVKWPLQGGQDEVGGLAYAETPTVSTAAVARSVSVKSGRATGVGMGMGLPGKARKIK